MNTTWTVSVRTRGGSFDAGVFASQADANRAVDDLVRGGFAYNAIAITQSADVSARVNWFDAA